MSRKLAELLVKDRIIPAQQFAEAEIAAQSGKSFIRYLIERGYLSEPKLIQYLSQKFSIPSINLDKYEIKSEIIQLLSPDIVKKVQAIPIQSNSGTVIVAIWDPTSASLLDDLKFNLKRNVEAVLTSPSAFDHALAKYYSGVAFVGAAIETYQKETKKSAESDGMIIESFEVHDVDSGPSTEDAPIISLVNSVLTEAIRRNASDIHVEPYENKFRVRLRIDGILHEITRAPIEMKRAVTARLKIMSRMDIAESRIPQDGRIKLKVGGRSVDFRVSSLPTLFGEKIVLRLLNQGSVQLDLLKLGFETRQLELFKKGIYSANGMVLVTGPTGSGKTTTLYSALSDLNKVSDNISTVEDPVEYNLEGINQVQVNKDIGLTFASVLRSLLRQDPDIVLVGEIRDYETAEVAIQAALTGHLVLSTVHTNDAASTITRMMNMGIEPFLVTASVNTIVAQRLLRTICAKCRYEVSVPKEKLVEAGVSPEFAQQMKVFSGKGCPACNQSGYRGRAAIYEVFDFTPDLKDMVLSGATSGDIKRAALKNGMKTLRMSALSKVAAGLTTLEEALSLTMEG